MGVNQFADLTPEEYVSQLVGFKAPLMKTQGVQEELEKMIATPTSDYIDWRNNLPPVKNQGSCGSCWSFSTISATEGIWSINNGGKIISLSEQQLVDCSKQNSGCNGGLMKTAIEDAIEFGGLCTEEDYPYTARDSTCKKSCQQVVKPAGYKYLPQYTTAAHKVALENGPIAIAVDASSSAFQFYSGGVVSSCKFSGYNHAVLLVAANNLEETFTIRNSWGASWGDKGYITFKQSDSKNVNCGVGTCEEDGQVYF
eukprot:UN01209